MSYSHRTDTKEDIAMQQRIRERADYSLAMLGMGAVYRGSGRFLNIRAPDIPNNSHKKNYDSINDKL